MAGSTKLALRRLSGRSDELVALQHVLEAVPRYARAVSGAPFGLGEAEATCSELPAGRTLSDKFVFGIYRDGEMVGCADLIRGYPVASAATLGLLVITEELQGMGLGADAYRQIEDVVRAWGTCDHIRIGVVRANEPAFPFWEAMGFRPTGEVRPHACRAVVSEAVVLEKPVDCRGIEA